MTPDAPIIKMMDFLPWVPTISIAILVLLVVIAWEQAVIIYFLHRHAGEEKESSSKGE